MLDETKDRKTKNLTFNFIREQNLLMCQLELQQQAFHWILTQTRHSSQMNWGFQESAFEQNLLAQMCLLFSQHTQNIHVTQLLYKNYRKTQWLEHLTVYTYLEFHRHTQHLHHFFHQL
jgi:hypothetical protein